MSKYNQMIVGGKNKTRKHGEGEALHRCLIEWHYLIIKMQADDINWCVVL